MLLVALETVNTCGAVGTLEPAVAEKVSEAGLTLIDVEEPTTRERGITTGVLPAPEGVNVIEPVYVPGSS
jgi:hypothetical protein